MGTWIVKQALSIVRTAEVEAANPTEAADVMSSARVASKCSDHEWPHGIDMVEEVIVEGDCGITVAPKTISMNCRQIMAVLVPLVAPYGWQVIWEHTGGGCMSITIVPPKERWVRPDLLRSVILHGGAASPMNAEQIMITLAVDVFGDGDFETPLAETYGDDDWDRFQLGAYEDHEEGFCIPFFEAAPQNVGALADCVLECVHNFEGVER